MFAVRRHGTAFRLPILLALQLPAAVFSGRQALRAQAVGSAATAEVDALVATRRLARGTVLTARDMARTRLAVRGRGAARLAPVSVGWVARRVIQAGEVLRPPAVAPAPLVAAGQPVQFTYGHDRLELTLDGVAPVNGALGDTIPVRLGARRRVVGVVTGPARVSALDFQRNP